MIDAKKRRGRQPNPPIHGRTTMTFRIDGAVRERLIEAADLSGRSLSEQIEFDLTRIREWEATWGSVAGMIVQQAEAQAETILLAAGMKKMHTRDANGEVTSTRWVFPVPQPPGTAGWGAEKTPTGIAPEMVEVLDRLINAAVGKALDEREAAEAASQKRA